MSQLDLKEYIVGHVRGAAKRFCDDLAAMEEEGLTERHCGTARACIDLAYETAFVNVMIADRIAGLTPKPFEWEGKWPKAPEGYSREVAIAELKSSSERIVAEIEAISDGQLTARTEVDGRMTSPFERANFAALHMMYHDAQLNYCQALRGDLEVHWS